MICASALRLYFKGGDERVFRVDDDMFGFALELQSDSELQGALLARFQSTTAISCGSTRILEIECTNIGE